MSAGTAVVSGGAGFLGSHLCSRLVEDGYEVICVDNFVTGSPSNVEHLVGHEGFHLIDQDVNDTLAYEGTVDLVLHFASPASPLDYLALPLETLDVGSIGTRKMVDLALASGARFVLASTSEAYGDPLVHPQPESYWGNVNPVGPRSVYDEAKRFAEALTTAYRTYHHVDTGIVRIFNTFGPRMRGHDGRAVPTFILQALRGEPLTVAGDGSQTRSLQYVDDLVEGVVRFAHCDHPGPVNIGNPEEVSMLGLAEMVKEMSGSTSPITFIPRPVDDPELRRPDISLARELLDWQPKVTTREGLEATIEWFRANRL